MTEHKTKFTEENDDLLLQQFFDSHRTEIPDKGFSRQVMRRLPRAMGYATRLWLGAAAVGILVLVALWLFRAELMSFVDAKLNILPWCISRLTELYHFVLSSANTLVHLPSALLQVTDSSLEMLSNFNFIGLCLAHFLPFYLAIILALMAWVYHIATSD